MLTTAQQRASRARVSTRLLAQRESTGQVGRTAVERLAATVGCSVPTLYRDIARGGVPASGNGRRRYTLSDPELLTVVAYQGRVKAAHRALVAAGRAPTVGYETFLNAWNDLPKAMCTALTEGQQEAKRYLLYNEVERPSPGEIAELDGWEPNIKLRATHRRSDTVDRFCYPHVFALVDVGSEFVLTATVKIPQAGLRAQLDDEFVAASLVKAVTPRDLDPLDLPYEGVELPGDWHVQHPGPLTVGGVVPTILHDNAKALISTATRALADAIGTQLCAVQPYTGEQKPHVERLFGTLERSDLSLLAGQTHGPSRYNGQDAWEGHATPEQFIDLLDWLVFQHNYLVPQTKLGGRTPFQAWVEAQPNLANVPDATLRPFRMVHPHKGGLRTVQALGVLADNRWYQAEELAGYRGRRTSLRIRIEPQEPSFVDVWTVGPGDEESFLTRATLNQERPLREKKQLQRARTQLLRDADRLVRQVGKVREVWSEALLTDNAPPEPIVSVIHELLDPAESTSKRLRSVLEPPSEEADEHEWAVRIAGLLIDLANGVVDDPDQDDEEPEPPASEPESADRKQRQRATASGASEGNGQPHPEVQATQDAPPVTAIRGDLTYDKAAALTALVGDADTVDQSSSKPTGKSTPDKRRA